MQDSSTQKNESAKSRANVALIGPVFPYRGGIAQHTTMIARALQNISNLLVISYSRQYPKVLYPGKSDRDPAAPDPEVNDLRYKIDSLNPLSWRNSVQEILRHKPQVIIIVWWTFFWAPCVWYMARRLKKNGIHIRFFCHNAIELSVIKTFGTIEPVI